MAGVSTDTLRYYERCHLLPPVPRSISGYLLFPRQAVVRVRLIQGALGIGFSVKELAAIFGERDRGGAPCHSCPRVGCEKLVALEVRLGELRSWRRELRKTLAEWDSLHDGTPRGQRAGLLEGFVASYTTSQTRSSRPNALARGNHKREKQQ